MPIEFLAIDTETTGLEADKHQIIDICLLLVDHLFEVKGELHLCAFPDQDAVLDKKALEVNKYDPEVWRARGAVTQAEMYTKVYDFVKSYSRLKLIAHNVPFDSGFLKALFEKHGAGTVGTASTALPYSKIIDYHCLDTMGVAMFLDYVNSGKARKSYRLAALTSDYGIEHENAHTARSDIYSCLNLLKAMRDAVKGTLVVAPGAMKEASNNYSKIIVKVDSGANIWEFHHGMYKGKLVHEVAEKEPSYIRNVLSFPDLSVEQRAYLESVHNGK